MIDPTGRTAVLHKLELAHTFSTEEATAIANLPIQIVEIRADQDIIREGDRPSRSFALIDGFTCCFKVTRAGRRQIVAFDIPGDFPDLLSLHLDVLDVTISTITPCRIGFVQHEALNEICQRHPAVAAALWRQTLVEASIFREWVTTIGQRPGPSRIAHLFCELLVRLRAVGLADTTGCAMPITQGQIGEATGLSTVHVNRSIQVLRATGLIRLTAKRLDVLDWDRLQLAADFDPAYLQMRG